MTIRRYRPADLKEIARLFYETVHTINLKDYTQAQVDAWATGQVDLEKKGALFQEHLTYVATENHRIIGVGDIDQTSYIDNLFVHKDHQRQGVATAICDRLESETQADIIKVHASITAKPFFETRGYATVKRQEVEKRGVRLTNYIMSKKNLPADSVDLP